jgi:type II secretory pathway pseudopilin PulG
MRKGFSLLESLLSLSLTLVIVLACLEFFGVSRAFFFRLKDRSEKRQAALAALDLIRDDVQRAGQGLSSPISLGLVQGLATDDGRLRTERHEKDLFLSADIQPGQTSATVKDAEGLKRKRRLCLFQGQQGQLLEILNVQDKTLTLTPAAEAYYGKEESHLLLLEVVDYYLDDQTGVIRKKENEGSGQPLLEDASLLEYTLEANSRLATIRLALRAQEEKIYEISVLPKNLALAFRR